jgi:hypothetical protein
VKESSVSLELEPAKRRTAVAAAEATARDTILFKICMWLNPPSDTDTVQVYAPFRRVENEFFEFTRNTQKAVFT